MALGLNFRTRNVGKLYRLANKARDHRDWMRARSIFKRIVELSPTDSAAWVQYGHALKESNAPKEAEAAYLKAAELTPMDADIQLQLGHVYKIIGLRDASIAAYRNAHALDPYASDPVTELNAYGVALSTPPRADSDDGELQQAPAFERLAGPAQQTVSSSAAVRRYENAVLASPENAEQLLQLGQALKNENRRVNAEHAYKAALKLDPAPETHLQLGLLYEDMGRWREAIDEYSAARAADPMLAMAGDRHTELRGLSAILSSPVVAEIADNESVYVIRGDINSTTGYAKAARSLAQQINRNVPVLGLPIHIDPHDNDQTFPFPLINDNDLFELAHRRRVVVVHHTVPEDLFPVPYARNVSAFYWETKAVPHRRNWVERLAFADAIWAPTRFVADIAKQVGYGEKVKLVPWAHYFALRAPDPRQLTSRIEAVALDFMPHPNGGQELPGTFAALRNTAKDMYLAIQSVAPRKGLAILIDEWLRHVDATPQGCDWLVLKLNFRHATNLDDLGTQLTGLLQRLGIRPGRPLRLALINQYLSDEETLALLQQADAYVSCTYGEGFGGPVAEALAVGTPVLVPRHTGIVDLVPAEYPFLIEHDERCVALVGNASIYPAGSTWHLPRPGSLCEVLALFSASPPEERRAAAAMAKEYADKFCGEDAVSRRVDDAMKGL